MRSLIIICLLAVTVSSVRGEEFNLLGGVIRNSETNDSSYSWQVEYLEKLNKYLAASLSYLNEGHVPSHHRDGHAVSLWARSPLVDRHLLLALGVGTYFFYDTTAARAGGDYSNTHGLGTIFSLALTWKTDSRWQYQIRSNAIKGYNSIDTLSVLAGIGCDLEDRLKTEDHGEQPGEAYDKSRQTGKNELTLLGGQTIVNSFNSDKSIAASLEYRRGLMRYLDATVAWIYEGDNRLLRRNGITPQLWLVDAFVEEKLELGVGAGAYFSVDHYRRPENNSSQSNHSVSAIVTLTAAYRFHPDWSVRTSWHRIVSGYDRDADILLVGVGYRF